MATSGCQIGKEVKMRNKNIKKQYWVDEEEDNLLKEKSRKAGLSESDFIRQYIKGYKVKEKPDDNFYYILRDLRGITIHFCHVNYVDCAISFLPKLWIILLKLF